MEIIIDLTFLLNALIFIAKNVNFNEVFAAVFCLMGFLTVAKITLNMLAEKMVKFSFVIMFFYILVGGAMFTISYTELKFVGDTFTNLGQVLFYSISQTVGLIALYASFLLFAHKANTPKTNKAQEIADFSFPPVYKAQIEEVPLNGDGAVVRLKTHSMNEPKCKVVDISGALKFIDSQISLGNTSLKPIRDKVAFYSGAELKDCDVAYLNELFSKAVKL